VESVLLARFFPPGTPPGNPRGFPGPRPVYRRPTS
jgi:hypothetical protein